MSPLLALPLLFGCSIDFERYLRAPTPLDASALDAGPMPPRDGGPGDDRGVGPGDLGMPPRGCRAPYLVAVAENLDTGAGRVLRWSFADERRCDDLVLTIARPQAVGVAFDSVGEMSNPSLVVASPMTVSVVDLEQGAVVRDLAVEGSPRSVFDIVSNGQGTFAVAYDFGNDAPPGSVGQVRVFDHRGSLREVQSWQRNMQFGLSILWMTAYPGNQGQYLQLRFADTGSGFSASVTSPTSMGLHPRTSPALIANRNNAVAITAYRNADRVGRYALAMSATGTTPTVFIGSARGSSSLTDTFVPTVRCSEPCPEITRAVAYPTANDSAAAICAQSGTRYTVVRVGGASAGCRLLDTEATPGRWRIQDLAVIPR